MKDIFRAIVLGIGMTCASQALTAANVTVYQGKFEVTTVTSATAAFGVSYKIAFSYDIDHDSTVWYEELNSNYFTGSLPSSLSLQVLPGNTGNWNPSAGTFANGLNSLGDDGFSEHVTIFGN